MTIVFVKVLAEGMYWSPLSISYARLPDFAVRVFPSMRLISRDKKTGCLAQVGTLIPAPGEPIHWRNTMKLLYRSSVDKKLAGICGGLGEMCSFDPTLVRLAFVFVGVTTGVLPAVFTYLVGWIIVPMAQPA